MCTSFTYTTTSKNYFLARTMDFGFELEGRPVVIPRGYSWRANSNTEYTTRYGFLGTGRDLNGYLLADGVNEHGLSIAQLYHLNEATYQSKSMPGKINLAPFELIMWVLGELKTVRELREQAPDINLLDICIPLLNSVPPLHYIIIDQSGENVVVEVENGQLIIKENPVGVMANSPSLEWHLTNLNNYLQLQPTNYAPKAIGNMTIKPFGQASGTFGLPGGYTSPERFVRTVFHKHLTRPAATTGEAVNNILKILNSVTIPKGVNIKDDGADDYTQYRAILSATERSYYLNPYESNEIYTVKLTEELLNSNSPKEFPVTPKMQIQELKTV